MKTLSAALTSALSGAVQKPAFLVSVGWATPLYFSTHGTVSYDGKSWTAADIDVSRIMVEAASVSGTLRFGNADDVIGALVLNEGVSDKAIRIIGYDAGATATADFVELVRCVGGRGTVNPDRIEITLRDSNAFVYSPRTFITIAAGSPFTQLMPAGAILNINGQTYRLERK